MMGGSALIGVAMVAMMILIMGGMLAGGGWAFLKRHGRRHD